MEAKTHSPTPEEFTIVERVASIVSSVRGSKPDYIRLANELEPTVPFDVLGIVLLRHDGKAVRVTACQREKSSWKVRYHQHPLKDSRFEQVLNSPHILVENHPDGLDGSPAATGDALSNYPYLHAILIVPLMVGDRVLGTLELGSIRPNAYANSTMRRLIQAVADVLATAIESAQMGGSAAIQDRQRQALKDVSSALTSKMDLSIILDHIVAGIANALNVASVIITLDQQQGLRLQAQSGLDAPTLHRVLSRSTAFLSDQSIIGSPLRYRQPIASHDLNADDRFPECRYFASELGVRSLYSYPLVTDMAVYGVLLLCSPEPGGFTPLKTDIVSLFASQATIAIHNSMLLEAAQQRRRFQHAIEQLEQAYAGSPTDTSSAVEDEYALLQRVREEALRTFGVSFTSLLRFIGDHLLTQGERNLQNVLQTSTQQSADQPANSPEESLALLTSTAEAALARASIISDVGAALATAQDPERAGLPFFQLSQYGKSDASDAWIATDLNGCCLYMNHFAEVFLGRQMERLDASYITRGIQHINHHFPTLEQLFTPLFPRIRNIDEVRAYLRGFTSIQSHEATDTLTCRCVVAIEPVYARSSTASGTASQASLPLDSAPTDHHYQFTRYPLYDQQGPLIAYALQVHDITEHVRDEKNKSALLSSVSHDLRTPLATIKAAVSGLLQPEIEWDEETRRKILTDVEAETDHLTVLVTALLDLSRIEMGALVLDKEWCDVVEIVYSSLDRLDRILVGRPIRKYFQPGLSLIHVDHVQVEHVFYNLIENAARNSPEGSEIILRLDVLGDPSHPHTLRAQVIDHGYGMPEDERERIFHSFYGFNSHGNGLGLAICKGVIEAHQGRIWVEPAPDGGSCFTFTLPMFSVPSGSSQDDRGVQQRTPCATSLFSSISDPVDASSEEQR